MGNVPVLRFSEFGGVWNLGQLGDLVDSLDAGISVNSGDTPAKNNQKGILKTSCVSNGVFDPQENKVVDNDHEISRLKEPVKADSVIISRMNTPALVGANAFVSKDYQNLFLPDRLWAGKINKNHIPSWVGILISHSKTRTIFSARGTGTSGSMKNITKGDVLTAPVTYPDKEEQQKIATFLSAVDKKLGHLRRKHELLENYKRGIMQKVFAQELRFKQDASTSSAQAQSKVAEPVEAFPDWEEKRLGDVLVQIIREVPKPKVNYLAIGIRSHMKGTFQKPDSDPQKIAMEKLFTVRENDLVVNITFAWEGAIAIVKKEDDGGLVSHRFPTYQFDSNHLLLDYFRHVIQMKIFKYTLDLISPGGAGRNRVMSKKEFVKIKWVFPHTEEQQKIANFLSTLDKKLDAVQKQIDQTESFKKGLLQKMFV